MTAVFPDFQQLPINLDDETSKLTDPEAVAMPTLFSYGDITTIQVAYVNTSKDVTTEPLVELSFACCPG